MPGYSVPLRLLKDKNRLDLDRYVCSKCELLLKDPVFPRCGHRLCKSCAGGLPAPAKCPRQDCKKDFVQENVYGEMYQPDDSVKQEIRNLRVICPHSEAGCKWEGKFHDYRQHKEICDAVVDLPSYKRGNVHYFYSFSPVQSSSEQQKDGHVHCCASAHVRPYELEDHKKLPHSGKERCPISPLTPPSTESYMEDCYQHEHHLHMQESDHSVVEYSHLTMMDNCRQLLTQREIVPVPASDHEVHMAIVMNTQELNVQQLISSYSNHDGTMIWRIPQFSQRKADAENGRSTSLF